MNVTKNGITITVADDEIVKMALARLAESDDSPQLGTVATLELPDPVPAIGEFWCGQGGVYAGIARGTEGGPDYYLIVGPEIDSKSWGECGEDAASIDLDGRTDFRLPTRKEQALCFANVPELFQKEWYWSCEQHAAGSGYAWAQHFSYGYQDYWSKHGQFRARAVRSLAIR